MLRRDPDHFGDRELVLVYIAKKLRHALSVEKLLTEAGIDYLVEVDYYVGGIIFRSERAGAFFYVEEHRRDDVAERLRAGGFRPQSDV